MSGNSCSCAKLRVPSGVESVNGEHFSEPGGLGVEVPFASKEHRWRTRTILWELRIASRLLQFRVDVGALTRGGIQRKPVHVKANVSEAGPASGERRVRGAGIPVT